MKKIESQLPVDQPIAEPVRQVVAVGEFLSDADLARYADKLGRFGVTLVRNAGANDAVISTVNNRDDLAKLFGQFGKLLA